MSDVFISYSRKNSDFAHKLDDSLRREKRDVWIDWQDIARGEDWWHSIQVGIDSADTALIVVTENWLVSEICQRELEYIRGQNKRVFPIMRQKIEGDLAIRVKGTWVDQEWENRARDNWKYIRSLNCLFLDDDTTFDRVFKDLLTALDTDQLYVKSHTRYLVRALEWQQFQRNPSFLLEGDQLTSAKTWLDSSANKHPEPHPVHHEYVGASKIAEDARIARDKAREGLVRRFRQMAIVLSVLVVIALIVAGIVGQQFFTARAEVTRAGATLQQVNLQVTAAGAQVQAAEALVGTATIEQGKAILAQSTSAAREQSANTQVAVAGATLSPVPPTLTAVAAAISDALDQQDIAAQIANASLLLVDKDFTGALQVMNGVVDSYPTQSLAYLGRGLIFDSLDRPDDAVTDYTKAIELDPESPGGYINRAGVYSKQGNYEKTIADYTKAIEIDPEDTDSYNNRGDTYSEHGEYDLALADFNQSIEIDPSAFISYIYRGLLYEETDRLNQALMDYQQAVKLNPQSVLANMGIGNVHAKQGDTEQGLTYYNRALEIDPSYAAGYNTRAAVYENEGEYDKAIADYKKTVTLDPTVKEAYYYMGSDYLAIDQLDQALNAYNQAISLDPAYDAAYIGRAVAYARMNKQLEASADYLKWIDLHRSKSEQSETVTQTQLPYSTTVTMSEGYAYSIPFEGRAGQLLQASAVAQESDSADMDALLVLLDPQGKPIMSADDYEDTTNAVINDFALPSSGLYTLVVSYSYNQSDSEGDLNVTLDLKAAAEATPAS